MLGYVVSDLKRFSASANKIVEVYYSHAKIASRSDAAALSGRVKGEIEFRNVEFKFGKEVILKNISFKVKAGETVAIMGETGSGKTTLVSLIPRIHDVTKGTIFVDGHDVRMLKLGQLRESVGMATQEVLLYSDTVEGNIAFGMKDTDSPEASDFIRDCAKTADAHEFIEKMTFGYDTIVGERGVGLSGGQKQRIALARALAVKPSILILDDTTSAVDSQTEKNIRERLKSLPFDCTKIIIAARISSAKDADKIIVLKDGKIAESGTHEQLLGNNGYYKEIYDLQN